MVSVSERSLLLRQGTLGRFLHASSLSSRSPALLAGTMSAYAAAWEQLPLGVQQHILMLTGSAWPRRVSKAWRDTFDAANDT